MARRTHALGIWLYYSVQSGNKDPERHLKPSHKGGKYIYGFVAISFEC